MSSEDIVTTLRAQPMGSNRVLCRRAAEEIIRLRREVERKRKPPLPRGTPPKRYNVAHATKVLARIRHLASVHDPLLEPWVEGLMGDVRTADEEVKRRERELDKRYAEGFRSLNAEIRALKWKLGEGAEIDAALALLAEFSPWQRLHQTGWHIETPFPDDEEVDEVVSRLLRGRARVNRRADTRALYWQAADLLKGYREAFHYLYLREEGLW